jgi:hypothetical protein
MPSRGSSHPLIDRSTEASGVEHSDGPPGVRAQTSSRDSRPAGLAIKQPPVEYPLLVAASEDLRRGAEESARMLASLAPESSMQAAALLRDVKPCLADDRQRVVAEEMARRFEERAAARSRSALP